MHRRPGIPFLGLASPDNEAPVKETCFDLGAKGQSRGGRTNPGSLVANPLIVATYSILCHVHGAYPAIYLCHRRL